MRQFFVVLALLGVSALLTAYYSFLISFAVLFCGGILSVAVFALVIQERNHAKTSARKLMIAQKKPQDDRNTETDDAKAA